MRVYHTKCNGLVTITSSKFVVKIIDVTLTEEGVVEPVTLDIGQERGGKSHCSCSKCKQDEIPHDELALSCTRCGNPVPINEGYATGKGDWNYVCKSCKDIIIKATYKPGTEPTLTPLVIKFR